MKTSIVKKTIAALAIGASFSLAAIAASGEDITPVACEREGQSPREKNSHSSTDCRSGQPARGSVLQMRMRLSKIFPSNLSSRRSL